MIENPCRGCPVVDFGARARRADPTDHPQRGEGLLRMGSSHRQVQQVYHDRSETLIALEVEKLVSSWHLPQKSKIGWKCEERCARFQHRTSRCDDFGWEGREHLPNDTCIGSTKLRCPGSRLHSLTFGNHAIQKRQDRWEMAAGDDRIGTFETAPNRDRAWTARFAKR